MVLELAGDAAGTVAEVGRASGVPTLSVPSGTARRPASVRAGEMVAAHLDLVRPEARSVLLTGTSGPDGAGRLALEVAAAWTPPGGRVVVVDAGAGEVTAAMGLDDRPGVTEALAGETVAPTAVGPTVAVLGARRGTSDRGADLGRVILLLEDLLGPGTRVVVHAPPAASGATTLAWSRAVDATVLVARRDAARRGQITQAADALRTVGADLAFTVLHTGGRKGPHLGMAPAADVRATPSRATEVTPA
jgi:Mrp family chromosome partitioning ATPase